MKLGSGSARRLSTLAALAAAAGLLLGGCDEGKGTAGKGGNGSGSSAPASGPSAEGITGRQATAPDGGTVTVVASGMSVYTPLGGSEIYNYAVVVENTSKRYAAGSIGLLVRLVDEAGRQVEDQSSTVTSIPDTNHLVDVALPGQRAAFSSQSRTTAGRPVRLEVRFVAAAWCPPGLPATLDGVRVDGFHPLSASGVTTERHLTDHAPQKIRFAVDSGYPATLRQPLAVAVFRDGSGAVLGGTAAADSTLKAAGVAPGRSAGVISTSPDHIPRQADDTRTEVYLIAGSST